MYCINRAQLLGHVTVKPENKKLPNSTSLTKVSIATNSSWKDKEGKTQDSVEYHNITCFGNIADIASKYLEAGSKVFCEGKLKTNSWEDKETQKKMFRTEIIAENLILLDSKHKS